MPQYLTTEEIYTLKHPGQRDPEKGPLGPNSIPALREIYDLRNL